MIDFWEKQRGVAAANYHPVGSWVVTQVPSPDIKSGNPEIKRGTIGQVAQHIIKPLELYGYYLVAFYDESEIHIGSSYYFQSEIKDVNEC